MILGVALRGVLFGGDGAWWEGGEGMYAGIWVHVCGYCYVWRVVEAEDDAGASRFWGYGGE